MSTFFSLARRTFFLLLTIVYFVAAPIAMAASPTSGGGSSADIFGEVKAPVGVEQYNTEAGGGLGIMVFFSNLVRLLTIVAGLWMFINFLQAGWTYITSAGDSGATKKAYEKFTMSVIGMVIIIASYTLTAMVSLLLFGKADFILNPVPDWSKLTTMSNLLAAAPSAAAGTLPLGKIVPVTDAYSKGSDTATGAMTNAELLISNVIGMITVVAGLFFMLYFFLGAFNWVTAGGDKGKVDKARDHMVNGAIGMIIIVAAYAVIGLVGSMLGYDLLNPGTEFMKLVPGASVPAPTP